MDKWSKVYTMVELIDVEDGHIDIKLGDYTIGTTKIDGTLDGDYVWVMLLNGVEIDKFMAFGNEHARYLTTVRLTA